MPDTSQHPAWVDPTGFESQQPQPECYDHPTLGDQLKANNITWRYYTPTPGVIWTAPAAISSLCGKIVNGICAGPDFANVIWPGKKERTAHYSWEVVSDTERYPELPAAADELGHPGVCDVRTLHFQTSGGKGPAYVANQVDAIGDSACKDSNGQTYWQDAAIFITWDDWGGWYDHVPPPTVYRSSSSTSCPPTVVPNGTAPLRPLAPTAMVLRSRSRRRQSVLSQRGVILQRTCFPFCPGRGDAATPPKPDLAACGWRSAPGHAQCSGHGLPRPRRLAAS